MSNIDYTLTTKKSRAGVNELRVLERKPKDTEEKREENLIDEKPKLSNYTPTDEEKDAIAKIRKDFTLADVVMRKPRREFNDMSVLSRLMVDQMSFNSYQPNNGDPAPGDYVHGWQSNAMRPIVRNKCYSIVSHITARTIYPKVFARNNQSENQESAAMVMRDLIDYVSDQIDYSFTSLKATLTATWSPVSIVELMYNEVLDIDGKLDPEFSGFKAEVVPADQLYVADFYESNIQRQPYIIRRKVVFYETAKAMFGHIDNFQYVKPGMQVLYNDANQLFYEVYDSVMRQQMVEIIEYYRRDKKLKLILANGVLMTSAGSRNPRLDGKYPFAAFGYEMVDEGHCFYYKSLAFKIQQDASIINTLYPMIIDGSYLSIFPPLINTTGEILPSNIIIPGSSTTLSQPNQGSIQPLDVAKNIQAGFSTLQLLETSINESSQSLVLPQRKLSAFEMSARQQEANMQFGPFISMVSSYVRQIGNLMIGSILQYMTIADVTDIEGDSKLVYKAFIVPNKNKQAKAKNKRIKFDETLPSEPISKEESKKLSFETIEMQGGLDSDTQLFRVNPKLFRELEFSIAMSPDIKSPLAEETERAFKLEIYDRGIQNPVIDQEKLTKDFLIGSSPVADHDPDKYIKKQQSVDQNNPLNMIGKGMAQPGGASPLNAVNKASGAVQIPKI